MTHSNARTRGRTEADVVTVRAAARPAALPSPLMAERARGGLDQRRYQDAPVVPLAGALTVRATSRHRSFLGQWRPMPLRLLSARGARHRSANAEPHPAHRWRAGGGGMTTACKTFSRHRRSRRGAESDGRHLLEIAGTPAPRMERRAQDGDATPPVRAVEAVLGAATNPVAERPQPLPSTTS